MSRIKIGYDEQYVLEELRHYLPTQAPLKDFIHHNTLHAFQYMEFHKGLKKASSVFGYKVYLLLEEYRELFRNERISEKILDRIIIQKKGAEQLLNWKNKLINEDLNTDLHQEIGNLRSLWKTHKHIHLDKDVHPSLFRLTGNYLDQGIAIDTFPVEADGFLASIRKLQRESYGGLFKSKRVEKLLLHQRIQIEHCLELLVGNRNFYERYLFELQFAHPGWSGMVAVLEQHPENLLQKKKISLHDFILVELLMEIESLDLKFGKNWTSLKDLIPSDLTNDIFSVPSNDEIFEVYSIWQEAMEWTYYDQALSGLHSVKKKNSEKEKSFQAVFCIDDRCCSFRRHIESVDPNCETFSSAGFFNVEFYFQPEHGKYFTKSCPAPLTPQFLIRESEAKLRHQKDAHFSRHNNGIVGGLLSSSTLGILSGIQLAKNIFYPSENPMMVTSFSHMDEKGKLSIEKKSEQPIHDLQLGFTIDEMTSRMKAFLLTIGLIENFSKLVYIIGHGASSVNNTHYAGYDCGACCGRAGSVNARVAAFMLNHIEVRKNLATDGIFIPDETQFVGGLHDTTRDEIRFFDENKLIPNNENAHRVNTKKFNDALYRNSKERSRRFLLMESGESEEKIHDKIRKRSLSLFEPRPEWNHATNCLCIVGKREDSKQLFFDRRAFLQSYDYKLDKDGNLLLGILKAIAPVCGGINLEYYFSRNDNYRLGAGSKLPHNVMGLIGVANGMDGDLRTGLPLQMINIHDPLRLMVIIFHYPDEALRVLKLNEPTYEWFENNWIHLVVIHPESKELYRFSNGEFELYDSITKVEKKKDLSSVFETVSENLPVFELID